MTIDWALVAFELLNFAVLAWLLSRFVFRPVRRVLEQRRVEIGEREQAMAEREQAAARLRAQFEGELERIDRLADERVAAALDEARRQADQLVGEARAQAHEILAQAEAELERGRRRALERFRSEVMSLAIEAAGRVVRELGAPEVGKAFARRAALALEQALGRDRPVHDGLTLYLSPELDPAELDQLVRGEVPAIQRMRIEHDPSLIGGVRLVADGHEIEASVGASLDAWYRRLIDEPRGESRLAS